MPRQGSEYYKLAALSDGAVGKSALIIQFVLNLYVDEFDPTVEDMWHKQCVIDDEVALLEILDVSGVDEYQALREQAMREGEGFLLVYSITSRNSFEGISTLHQQILHIKGRDFCPVIIVANRCDLEHQRQVGMNEGSDLAKHLGCRFIETSAKERINVDEVFNDLVREIRKYNNKSKEQWEDVTHSALAREPAHRDLPNTPAGGIITRILKGWTGRYDGELKKHREEVAMRTKDEETQAEPQAMEAVMHARGEETKAKLQDGVDREREEIERIKHDSERMATDFNIEKSRLESRIMALENENHRYAEELEGQREQVIQTRKEGEALQNEYKRREMELLNEKKEAEERKARQLEEERNARELAEAQYQEHLSALQHQILRIEAEKKWAETEYDANVRAERERALALDMELQRQVKVKEEEERARLLEEERHRTFLQDAIERVQQEVENLIAEQERRECEATFASQGQVEAQALLLERQSQVLQHEKERCQRQILEETERVRGTLEEAHSKKEQEAQDNRKAEEARIRQLEEQQALRLEEERRRLSFLEEYAHEHEESNVASKDQPWRARQSEMLRQAREIAIAKLEEECQQATIREEAFKKQLKEEVARVCKPLEQELVAKERQAVEVQCAARLSRALAHEAQEKARLVEEHKHTRIPAGELAVLHRRVAEAEDYRRRLEHQQVLSRALVALEELHSLYTLTDVKSVVLPSRPVLPAPHPVNLEIEQ